MATRWGKRLKRENIMEKCKEYHSEQRHKFQNSYIEMIIHTMPINELIEFFKIKTRMNLYKLTDEELIDLIENVAFENIYHITQWDEFIDFVQYVKGQYN